MQDLTDLFKDSRLVALITDAQGQVVATTPGAGEVQGANLRDLMGISLPPEAEDAGLLRSFSQVRPAGSPMHVVVLLRGESGQVLTLHVEDFALRQASGEYTGWKAAGRDLGRSQAEARCTQSILTTLVDTIRASFWAFDPAGTVATWSRPCEGYFGVSRAEAEGKLPVSRLFAQPEALTRALQEVEAHGRFVGEMDLVDHAGNRRPNQVTLNRLTAVDGEVLGTACVAFDVTDRKKLEEYRRVLFDEARSGLILAEADTLLILSSNAEAARILRAPAEGMVGTPLASFLPAFDAAEARRETVGEGAGHDGVYERHCTLGEGAAAIEVECRARVIRLGLHEFFLADLRDITERVRAAAQLGQANAFLEKLRDEAPDAVYLLDAPGRFVYTNPSGARLAGRERDAMLGHGFDTVTPPERLDLHREIFRKVLQGEPARFRTDLLHPDGGTVPVEVSAAPVASAEGRFVLAIARDISAQIREEEEARAAYGALETRVAGQAADLERARYALEEESSERERAEGSFRALLERTSRQGAGLLDLLRKEVFAAPDAAAAIRSLLESATILLDADRALLWRTGDGAFSAAAEYERKTERHGSGRTIRAADFPAWVKTLAEGETVAVPDAARDERTREFWREHLASFGLISTLVLPVRRGPTLAGWLQVDAAAGRPWEPDERALGLALAGLGGLLLSHFERDARERRLVAQNAATQILAEAADLKAAAPRLLRSLCETLAWDAAALWTVDPATDQLRCAEFAGEAPQLAAGSREAALGSGMDLPGRVRASGKPVALSDLTKDTGSPRAPLASRDGVRGAAATPVASGLQVLGVIELFSREARESDPALLELLASVGRQLGRFIEQRTSEADRVKRLEEVRKAYEELKRTQSQLIRSEKLASISMLLSGFAREMNDPLGDLSGTLEKMDEIVGSAPGRKPKEVQQKSRALKDTLRTASSAARRAMGMLEDFGDLARDPRSGGPTDLLPCLEEAVALLPSRLMRTVKIVRQLKPLPPVRCIPEQMVQVFQHLLLNAVESIEKKGSVEIRTVAKPGQAVIEISDTGVGMTDEVQARLFDPFFTTKQGHAGMGLAVSAMIVQNHGGQILINSRLKKGTTFTVELPAQP